MTSLYIESQYLIEMANNYFRFAIYYDNINNLTEELKNFSSKELYLGLCEEYSEEKEELDGIKDDRSDLINFIFEKIEDEMQYFLIPE